MKKDEKIEEMRLRTKERIHEEYANAIMWAAFWIALGIIIAF